MLRALLIEKQMTLYQLEKLSHVSHATLNDLYNERTNIQNCSASLVHNISSAMKISMDRLYAVLSYQDLSPLTFDDQFDLFKSNVCHELAALGDIEFIKNHLSNNSVQHFYDTERYPESLYLLSMLDYLCKKHSLPIPTEYHEIRKQRLKRLFVSKSVYLLLKTKVIKISELFRESIKDFLDHNILESDFYNVN